MNDISKDAVLETVTQFYLHSGDFNGVSAAELVAKYNVEWRDLHDVLCELIEEDCIGLLHVDHVLNTHILRLSFAPKEVQIQCLETDELYHTCLYPRPKHLETVVDRARYEGKPYTLCLALGEPQLAYRSFDLSVLEFYCNDPRYIYQNDDINGFISIQKPEGMADHDQVLLESFGFAYDADFNRAVAVFLRYLADLSPEHQRIWHTKELTGDYRLHPDYYQHSIIGDWGEGVSIFTAFLEELHLINQMADAMGRPDLFRQIFDGNNGNRPTKFSFLVRPTLEEFNAFVLLLDKMLSDNINKDFFRDEIPATIEVARKDGKIEVRQKGTLQMLDDWVHARFHLPNWKPWNDAIMALRRVRKLRQQPAHTINENVFDQHYFKEQRQLIIDAYDAIRTIRLLLANHRAVKASGITAPDWLQNGTIWTR